MSLCNFSWDLASKFIPSIITAVVAIFIFWQWRQQKGSEVIAKEARELRIGRSKLQSIECKMSNLIYRKFVKNLANELKEYKEFKKEVDHSYKFFLCA